MDKPAESTVVPPLSPGDSENGYTIHNGQVFAPPNALVKDEPIPQAAPKPPTEPSLDPEQLAAAMAHTISQCLGRKPVAATPMEIVNALLQLTMKDSQGRLQKLVWTRWDVHQAFAIWSSKLQGTTPSRLPVGPEPRA